MTILKTLIPEIVSFGRLLGQTGSFVQKLLDKDALSAVMKYVDSDSESVARSALVCVSHLVTRKWAAFYITIYEQVFLIFQTKYTWNLSRIVTKTNKVIVRPVKTQISLDGCPCWFESLLGAHATLLVLSRGGSHEIWVFSQFSKVQSLTWWGCIQNL